ncbi:MAG: sodium:phosphate symporter [Deltaproteobacteria bacterium CG11_big_fil_rev_8_21_14_0_20_45_16]|nr:MAG: sodium:phosphate symporter [Deltaproteobacteria bacterium CG11_big_fil_rev_8_21_14_0_20_45_16]
MNHLQTKIKFLDYLSAYDWLVFSLVAWLTLLAILYGQQRKSKLQKSENWTDDANFLDLLLMGRQLSLPMFVATLVATWYGGIIGVTQIAYEKGIYNFLTQGVFWYVTYLIFAFILISKIRKFEALTLPDLVGQMFGPKSRKLSGIFNFFNVVPVAYSISIGLLIQLFLGISLPLACLIGTFSVVLYSMSGGFRAVVYSDIVQFVFMIASVGLVLIFSINHFGGLSYLESNLPASHFDISGGEPWMATFVWGLIALSTLVDPNFYQRVFAAQTENTAKWGILISTAVWFVFDICTTFGALYARASLPEADSSQAYLSFSIQILPEGLRGLFLAGIFATILSTLDSYIFTAGTTLSFDLLPKRFNRKLWCNHLGIVSVGLLSVILAVGFDGNIKKVWKTLGSYSAACLLLPVMLGYVFPGRFRDRDFIWAVIVSAFGVTFWRYWDRTGFLANVDEIYVGSLLSVSLMFLSSVFRK